MSIQISQATPGRKVTVLPFEGVITKVDAGSAGDYCVEVTADDGSVSYVYETQLNPVLPYVDGTVYASRGGSGPLYTYVAGPDGGEGKWRNFRLDGTEGTLRGFTYPDRPMVEAILGDDLND